MPKRVSSSSLPIGGFKPGGIFLVPTDVPPNIPPDWLGYIRVTGSKNESPEIISLPLSFETGTTITWVYLTLNGQEFNAKNMDEKLNQLGKERWELCSIVHRSSEEIWIFKRPFNNSDETKK
jgi:hypothetical protein